MSPGGERYFTHPSSSEADESTFPVYRDGDVKIVITGSRQYHLHSTTLKHYSSTFRALLSDENAAPLDKKAIKNGRIIRYRLDAVDNSQRDVEPDLDLATVLQPVKLGPDGKAPYDKQIPLDLENGRVVARIYDVSLRRHFLYGQKIELGDEDVTLGDKARAAALYLRVADYLDVLNVVQKPIEADLLACGQLLYSTIVKEPEVWLSFAFRLKSRSIFREALIHAAGQFNRQGVQDMLPKLDVRVAAVLEKKASALKESVKLSQLHLLSYYPPQFQRDLGVGYADIDKIGKNSYSNDIFGWMALDMFRIWIAQNCASDYTHHAQDMGYEFMRRVGQGGPAYLAKPDLEGWYQKFPMTDKGKQVVERWLDQIKEHVKPMASRLLENASQYEYRKVQAEFFSCTKVSFNDYEFIQ
ncbi:hypothetical protein LTR37_005643 [Vermiconidia calcicola]|uniref:Uncharacterized protein n=1 Tax=Vermiconidia calcicola TaxID=1690605 RepID=A0ACC3NJY7_9PEZI|nr:hypothetical protein LTR37_005643 [Vermiconidia calcicola]